MVIDNSTIDKLAKLSSLTIAEDKKEILAKELGQIVEFVENLNDIDVSSVEATFTTISGGQQLREDIVVKDEKQTEAIRANAPKSEDGYFIVPAIIE
jgi:aspartyl-tRNA(Asn)/glutamyl-tRNA(Gln) amidotransferase subunit C